MGVGADEVGSLGWSDGSLGCSVVGMSVVVVEVSSGGMTWEAPAKYAYSGLNCEACEKKDW
eukprot:scaffold5012_cov160-Cylindrotheca_fusiformis.AAC.1